MSTPLRTLIIDDSEDDALLLIRHLKQYGFEPDSRRVDTAEALHSAVADLQWDAILCDAIMPRLDALTAVEMVRSLGMDVPFIVVSGTVGEEQLVELMKAGAHDIIVKDRMSRLGPAIERELEEAAVRREHKGAAGVIQEREKQLHLIADNLPILIAYLDLEQRYRFINETGAHWYARDRSQVIGRTVAEVLGEVAYGHVKPYLDRVAEGLSAAFDATVTYPDGVEREIHGIYVPGRDGEGDLKGFVAMAIDMTDRKRTERALRDREEFIRAVVDNVADAIITIGESGDIESFNASAERSFGYSASEVQGRNVAILMPEPYRRRHDDYLARYVRAGRSGIMGVGPRELPGQRKDGSTFPLELAIGEAQLTGRRIFVGAARDISNRISAERALRESEERFRSAFETAPHGMALMAPDGRWLKVNRALCHMVGYGEGELLETGLRAITHPDDLAAQSEEFELMSAGQVPSYQSEMRLFHKDGPTIWVLLSVSVVRDQSGAPLYFVAQMLDLTERKKHEEQLAQAHKMEAVGQLTGGIAHDFNNLLTVVLGNLQLLERSDDASERQRELASRAISAARRGADLTQRLLAFSRRQVLEPVVLDLNAVVAGTEPLMQRTLGGNIEIRTALDDELWHARIDAGQLESALLNLAINARDTMPDGGQLTIATSNAVIDRSSAATQVGVEPGAYAMISVTDTGEGIPPEILQRVFEPFFTTKEVGKGTGLGLSMVFGFMKQSGGHVSIYSEVGVGTTVRLYFPRVAEATTAAAQTETTAQEAPAGDEVVLVVEDDRDVRETIMATLDTLGYRVHEAGSGPEGLEFVKGDTPIDLLITDVVMPGGMNGLELAQEARRLRPALKVVMTSGFPREALARDHGETSGIIFVRKPYQKGELALRVREALDG